MASRSKAGRGTKRKAGVAAEAEPMAKQDKGSENKQEDDQGQRVIIEHWNANAIREALVAEHPDLRVLLNPKQPRRNSFEITLMEDGKEVLLWTGIKKGPPRKLKFPDPAEVVSALEDALKSK